LKCPYGMYHEANDAWKGTATTKDSWEKDCCKSVATCANTLFSCPAGMKRASGVAPVKCPGGPSSCAQTPTCCTDDTLTCGGYHTANSAQATCVAPMFIGSGDAWKKIALAKADELTFRAACCGLKPTCGSATCPAGYKKNTAVKNTQCAGFECKTAKAADADVATCCSKDALLCGGGAAAPTCQASQYYPGTDGWKNRMVTAGCCTAKATCAQAACPSGYKMRKNVETLSCSGDHTTCKSRCCELDNTKCGGQVNIQCPYGSYDESSTWTSNTKQAVKDAWNNKPATAATRHSDCCTPQAACQAEGVSTTPVIAAPTVTPAAPARLYSQHEAASKEKKDSKLLWVGLGSVTGMAILLAMQHKTARAAPADGDVSDSEAREVKDILLQ